MDRPQESLFEETKMSFGDHIEELRVRLFKAVIGVVIGFLLGLYFSNYVVIALQAPLKKSISEFKAKQSKEQSNELDFYDDEQLNDLQQPYVIRKIRMRPVELAANSLGQGADSPTYPFKWTKKNVEFNDFRKLTEWMSQPESDTKREEIWASLSEEDQETLTSLALRSSFQDEDYLAVVQMLEKVTQNDEVFSQSSFVDLREALPAYTRIASFSEIGVRQHLIAGSYAPYLSVPGSKTIEITMLMPAKNETMATSIEGPFMIWMKTGFIVGLVISAPWVFYQIWAFIAAGLYPHERRYVHLYLPISLLLFVGGALFAFYVVFHYVLDFLFQFNATMGISPDPRVNEYIGFVMLLPLGFGVAFQLPLVMLFFYRFGIISISAFLSKWRIAILVISIVSMLLTPQDPMSMALMAIPLTLLYFIGILMCRFMPGGRNPFKQDEVYDPA